ncbi:DUF2851 family protein [Cecembia calidifontis]|jgi:hypothetical protein|uniref:Uncharacterized protein DUF2851 n=1 Tax=Cecembia calidifontis TaxID=1187080 RepID=A0A4Q7P4B5_9BACT|nr:DUF2851 family protein [Cecembia calidifontis]RZS94813.1 uncharacterized protein DUF2851 [Cecembia calidifontis]
MDFQENFLQTVWKYQYFDKKNLQTTTGQNLEVKKIGFHNFHEGPDFLEAHLKIGNLDYHGHVEIHRNASDWNHHAHSQDDKYNSVILHVVFNHDVPIFHRDGSPIPTLELKGKIWLDVIRNYERLTLNKGEILCGDSIGSVPQIIKFSMLEKALVERMELKSQKVLEILQKTGMDWEETAYRWMLNCFGFKTNSDSMLILAESLPFKILQKQGSKFMVLEALLLGQAGLLYDASRDERTIFLKSEYDFYQKKYGLKSNLNYHDWKFMGVRPGNFPYQRIAQLAQIIAKNPSLFSTILDASQGLGKFKEIFTIEVAPYWQQHTRPGISSKRKLAASLSKDTINLLIINLITPLWYAYGQYLNDPDWKEKCFELLQEIPSENNFIIRKFAQIGWPADNAFDSQGMIGLYRQYCKTKRCLDCKIGQSLLKPTKR